MPLMFQFHSTLRSWRRFWAALVFLVTSSCLQGQTEYEPTPEQIAAYKKELTASQQLLRSTFKSFAESTRLPETSVDPEGKILPKDFRSYLEDTNAWHKNFLNNPPAIFKEAAPVIQEHLGENYWNDLNLIINLVDELPDSSLDFILMDYLNEIVTEYPVPLRQMPQDELLALWTKLSNSRKPLYRYLAISRIHRALPTFDDAYPLVIARLDIEEDPKMIEALINALFFKPGFSKKLAPEAQLKVKQMLERLEKKKADSSAESISKDPP